MFEWKLTEFSTIAQTHTHTAVVHLTLSLGCQVSTPADDLAVFPSSAEQCTTLQGAQGKHAAFMCSGLSHDLEGLWDTKDK